MKIYKNMYDKNMHETKLCMITLMIRKKEDLGKDKRKKEKCNNHGADEKEPMRK